MKTFLLRITIFLFSFFVIFFFLYVLFYPLYTAESVTFSFAITPFDIAKVYPKIWIFIKKTYFFLLFISYTIVFNYLYSAILKYFKLKKINKNSRTNELENFDNNDLKLLIGTNQNRKTCFYARIWIISKHANYWNDRYSEKLLLLCILLLVN